MMRQLSSKPILLEFNAIVTRSLHLLKTDAKEEVGHIFIKVLKKLKILLKNKMVEALVMLRVVTEDDSNLVLSYHEGFENDLSKKKFIRVHHTSLILIR
jgi:hypothetical protein